ncbi:MAG: TSCPD domain-containing protein [Eubacteriales bacterium]|nr:TSCPD domain-containing protein [Eubacteriales bacterium]
MEKTQSRREFLKTAGKLAAGAALLSGGAVGSLAEVTVEEPKVDYHWKADALPCDLIKEVTESKAAEGVRSFQYTPDGRAHITNLTFDVKVDDMTVHNIKFTGGCDGSTQGVAVMAEGKAADFIVSRLKGLQCNLIKSGSSCPDQLANAVEQAVKTVSGKSCTFCFFAGNFRAMKCTNA